MDRILEILTDLNPDIDYENAEDLIDDGKLDSFDIVALIGELQEEFDIEIGADEIVPENFNTLEAITALVERLSEE